MPTRKAHAQWEGGLKGGKGSMSTESGAVKGAYSFGSRFENAGGSNPEELLAASHAGCFSMALSAALERAGQPAPKVVTDAACTVEKVGEAFKVTKMHLTSRITAAGLANDELQKIATGAKEGCPISGVMKGNVEVTLDAQLA